MVVFLDRIYIQTNLVEQYMKHTILKVYNRFSILALILAGSITGPVLAQERITLKRATELVLENNLQIKQAKFSEAISEVNLSQSKLAIYPTLNANTGLNFNYGRSIDLNSNQFINRAITSNNATVISNTNLFQGFRRMNEISQNKVQLEADKSNTQKVKNDLVLAVVTNYLSVLNAQDLLTASRQQLDIANQLTLHNPNLRGPLRN
jgi:outer membrane protein